MDSLHLSSFPQRSAETSAAGESVWPQPDTAASPPDGGATTWTGRHGGIRWAVADGALWREGGKGWERVDPPAPHQPVAAAALAAPGVWVAAGGALFYFDGVSR